MLLQVALVQDTAITTLLDNLVADTASFMQMTKLIRRELRDDFGRNGYGGVFILHSFASVNMVSLVSGVAVDGLTKKREYFNSEFGWGNRWLKVRKPYSESGVLLKPVGYLGILDIEVPYLALDPRPEIETLLLLALKGTLASFYLSHVIQVLHLFRRETPQSEFAVAP
jgi:hypothetical protein